MLVSEGKHGADSQVAAFTGKNVQLRGTKIYRDNQEGMAGGSLPWMTFTKSMLPRPNFEKPLTREMWAGFLQFFAPGGFTDMSEGGPSKYCEEAKLNFRVKVSELFKEYLVKFPPIVNRVVVLGDTAYDYGGHEFILTPKSGGPPIRKR